MHAQSKDDLITQPQHPSATTAPGIWDQFHFGTKVNHSILRFHVIDSVEMTISLPEMGPTTARNFCERAFQAYDSNGLTSTPLLQKIKNKAFKTSQSYGAAVTLHQNAREELIWWQTNPQIWSSVILHSTCYNVNRCFFTATGSCLRGNS